LIEAIGKGLPYGCMVPASRMHELIVCVVHLVSGSGLIEFAVTGPGVREPSTITVFGVRVTRYGLLPIFPMALVRQPDGTIRGGLFYALCRWAGWEHEQDRTNAGVATKRSSFLVLTLSFVCFMAAQVGLLVIGLSVVKLPGPTFPVTVEATKSEALFAGDIIQRINGQSVSSAMDLAQLDSKPVLLTVLRAGKEQSVTTPGDSFTFKRGEYQMTLGEAVSVVRMMTIDAGRSSPERSRHVTMLMMTGHPLGISHYFSLLFLLRVMTAAFVIVLLCEVFCSGRGSVVQRSAVPQRGVGFVEYAIIISTLLVAVNTIEPLSIWGVKFPFCYYVNSDKVSSSQQLIDDGYFNVETGGCRPFPEFIPEPPYW
jgi:hypothetical protein